MSLKLLQLSVATAALATSVDGLSMPHSPGDAFSVDAFTPSTPADFDPVAELQRLEAKFAVVSGGDTVKARSYKQAGSAKVKPSSTGLSFLVLTVIGNQTLNPIYDTDPADLSVYSNESSPWQSLDHPTYVPTSSSEFLSNHTFAIQYAQGDEISGVVFKDTVKAGSVIAHKQATFVETLISTLKRKLFAANLRADGKPSSWDFGYIDNSKFKGKIGYTPVTSKKHWAMNVDSYAVAKRSFTNSKKTIGDVIVDSGTSLIYLPKAVVNDYYSKIKGYKLADGRSHIFPCNTTIPDFYFKTEGITPLTIPGRDVNYTIYDPNVNTCVGGITTQLNGRYSALGNLSMKNYYVNHSQEATPKLGIAAHPLIVGCCREELRDVVRLSVSISKCSSKDIAAQRREEYAPLDLHLYTFCCDGVN